MMSGSKDPFGPVHAVPILLVGKNNRGKKRNKMRREPRDTKYPMHDAIHVSFTRILYFFRLAYCTVQYACHICYNTV